MTDTRRLLRPIKRKSGLPLAERKAQIAALPPKTNFCNIYPDHGWRVMMRRRNHLYFGGHFMDLTEAVAGRDRMWAKYEGNLSGSEPDT